MIRRSSSVDKPGTFDANRIIAQAIVYESSGFSQSKSQPYHISTRETFLRHILSEKQHQKRESCIGCGKKWTSVLNSHQIQ